MSLFFSKLPLPPAEFDNNNNTICKPWELPTLFERTVNLDDITSDRACRHIAIEPKNKLVFCLQNELDKIQGDVKAIHRRVGVNNATVISFYDILDAKKCFGLLKENLKQKASVYYVKASSVSSNDSERVFVVFNSINNRVDLLNYDYMKHVSRYGSIYSISEARISRSCILLNVEYHDERHGQELRGNLNCSFIEGAQVMVYNAVSNDQVSCACYQDVAIGGLNRVLSITTNARKSIKELASYQANAATTQNTMVATPLPSPVADTYSFFSTDSFAMMQYPHLTSLPPSPVAAHSNVTKPLAISDDSPSSSGNTTYDTCTTNEGDCIISYAAVAQTVPTESSPTQDTDKSKVQETPSVSIRSTSRKKKSSAFTKKAASNSVDTSKIQTGIDKRTTFMIRNIPNKYTQKMLIDYVNATHKNKYDFLYLRIDFQNKCNVGYAFINFINPKDAVGFANERVGKKWQSVFLIGYTRKLFKSDKKCDLAYANIQGKEALIKKFQNSQVLSEDIAYQPKLFYSNGPRAGQEQPWPNTTTPIRK